MKNNSEKFVKQAEREMSSSEHYYGDYVRRLFLISAFVWIAVMPFTKNFTKQSIIITVFGMLVLVIAAGLTSPAKYFTAILNIIISLIAVVFFEWSAINLYIPASAGGFLFWIFQLLTINFLFALYYGGKTLRDW